MEILTIRKLLKRGWKFWSNNRAYYKNGETLKFIRLTWKIPKGEYQGNFVRIAPWGFQRIGTLSGLERALNLNLQSKHEKLGKDELIRLGFKSIGNNFFKKDFGNYYIVVSVFSKETTIDGKLSDGRDFLLVRGATIRSLHEVIEFYGDKTK